MNKEGKKGGGRRRMKWILIVLLVLIFVGIMIVFPPSTGKTKRILDDQGKEYPNSLSEKCYIDVDGGRLGMILMASDTNKPVLLFCGGGPGMSEYFLEYEYPSGLEKEFVVCYFEYRGCGLSYDASAKPEEMTTERYVKDVLAVTDYLQKRFGKDKIYLMGHSFGTGIAILAAKQHPEYYEAYVAMSQISNQPESERMAYEYMKAQYEAAGNKKRLRKFESYEQYAADPMLRDVAMHELGVGTARNMKSLLSGIILPSLRFREFSPKERIHMWIGKARSSQFAVEKDSFLNANLQESVPSLELPVFFFAGKYDYTCCYSLQKEYYEKLEAPEKRFYTFESSAHSPLFEEPEKAMEILAKDVLHVAE